MIVDCFLQRRVSFTRRGGVGGRVIRLRLLFIRVCIVTILLRDWRKLGLFLKKYVGFVGFEFTTLRYLGLYF